MRTSKLRAKLLPFDAARYLTDDAAVTDYMTAVREADDPDLVLLALGDVDRARLATLPLERVERLPDEENNRLWIDEAERRSEAWDAKGEAGRPAVDVLRAARARFPPP